MTHGAFATIPEGRIEALPLPYTLYPQPCIEQAIESYAQSCIVTCTAFENGTILSLEVRPQHQAQARDVAWSFLTEL